MSATDNAQNAPGGRLRHLISLSGLSKDLLRDIFADADSHKKRSERTLAGQLFVNIFFENSTRTRAALEAAAKQLGADVVNLDQMTMSGEAKSESLEDTVRTVAAMGAAGIGLRHSEAGAATRAAKAADESGVAVINGGTGCESHPTQGLTDGYTLREIFGEDFSQLTVAIVGDILHSRVARSNAQMLKTMGAKNIRLIGPPDLCPPSLEKEFGAPVFANMDEGLQNADVVMLLRIQRERLQGEFRGASPENYCAAYGLTSARLSRLKSSAIVMHPGPINRGMEIEDAVADGEQSRILRQVKNGMAIRKAILSRLCAKQ